MSSFLKPLLGATGLVGITCAVCVGGINNSPPHWTSLSSEAKGSLVSESYANSYSDFLVGVEDGVDNANWWNWSFETRYKPFTPQIQHNSDFYKLENSGELREACKSAYRGTLYSSSQVTNGGKSYPVSEIWRFCSSSSHAKAPTTLKEGSEPSIAEMVYSDLKGKEEKLISTHEESNDWIWGLKQKKFLQNRPRTGFFSERRNGRTVKDKCGNFYNKYASSSFDSQVKEGDLMRWCGLSNTWTKAK